MLRRNFVCKSKEHQSEKPLEKICIACEIISSVLLLFADLLILSLKVDEEKGTKKTPHTKGNYFIFPFWFIDVVCFINYALKHLMYVFQLYGFKFYFYASEWHNKYERKILWLLVCFYLFMIFWGCAHITNKYTSCIFKKQPFSPSSQKYMIKFFRFSFYFGGFFLLLLVSSPGLYLLLHVLFSYFPLYVTKHKNHNKNYEFITLHGKITF